MSPLMNDKFQSIRDANQEADVAYAAIITCLLEQENEAKEVLIILEGMLQYYFDDVATEDSVTEETENVLKLVDEYFTKYGYRDAPKFKEPKLTVVK